MHEHYCFHNINAVIHKPRLLATKVFIIHNKFYYAVCVCFLQNQEFKEHPENFKSIGDFTLDGEGSVEIPKTTSKKKPAGKAGVGRQQSLSGNN